MSSDTPAAVRAAAQGSAGPHHPAADPRRFYVFVDECHRTQGGDMNKQIKRWLENAIFIGFTGTPLLLKDKQTTREVFGTFSSFEVAGGGVDNQSTKTIHYFDIKAFSADTSTFSRLSPASRRMRRASKIERPYFRASSATSYWAGFVSICFGSLCLNLKRIYRHLPFESEDNDNG
jgi:hypothetical protein